MKIYYPVYIGALKPRYDAIAVSLTKLHLRDLMIKMTDVAGR